MRSCGHVETIDEYSMAGKMLMTEVSEGGGRDRPSLGRMDGVEVALGSKGLTVEATRQLLERVEISGACVDD